MRFHFLATFSAVIPMWMERKASVRPSVSKLSSRPTSPNLTPGRMWTVCRALQEKQIEERGKERRKQKEATYLLMLSIPPARTIELSPRATACGMF